MTDQPTDQPTPDAADDLTDDQQQTMDGVGQAIDEAKKAEADLRAVDEGAIHEPADGAVPDTPGPEA